MIMRGGVTIALCAWSLILDAGFRDKCFNCAELADWIQAYPDPWNFEHEGLFLQLRRRDDGFRC